MKYSHQILLTLAVLISGCATPSPSRTAALDLHQKLGQSHVIERYPDEYRSFITTVSRAESLAQRGELLQAENVYQVALHQGRTLEQRTAMSASADNSAIISRQQIAQADAVSISRSDPAATGTVESEPGATPPAEMPPDGDPQRPPDDPAAPVPEQLPESLSPPGPDPGIEAPLQNPPTEPPVQSLLPVLPGDAQPNADMKRFIGSRGYYTVRKGDNIKQISARLGVDRQRLIKINHLDPKTPLKPGQIIVYDNRRIVPAALRNGIVINIADRTLYLLRNGEVRTSYPVALGKPPKPDEEDDWTTPTGRFIITAKAKDPVWRVPQSIQEEMEERGKQPVKEVPPGKDNPLGQYALKTSLSGIVIHSTNVPSSINTYASHGCIRVMPEHMEKLFPAVAPRTTGIIVYQPVKLAVSPNGKVFLEVNRDVYDRFKGNLESEVRKLIVRHKVEGKIDWNKVGPIIRKKSGVPEEITLDLADTARLKLNNSAKQNTVLINRPPAISSLQ